MRLDLTIRSSGPLLLALSASIGSVRLASAQKERLSEMKVVRLTNGSNVVDLDGDKRPDLIVMAWLENNNAHGYNLFTFYIQNQANTQHPLNLVVFADSSGVASDGFRTSQGADCVLSDLRLLQPRMGPDLLVIGRRDFGESYADSLPVTFTVYRLGIQDEGIPGVPPFQFVPERTIRSRARFCDVNDAFRAELGLAGDR